MTPPVARRFVAIGLSVGLAGALAAALLYLAVPRAVGGIAMLRGDALIRRIQAGERLAPEQLRALERSRLAAARWLDSGRLRTDIGLARLLQAAARDPGDPERARLLGAAVEAISEGLARAPANAAAWTRLAFELMLRDGPSAAMVAPLRTSILTNPHDRKLAFVRLELSFRAWPWFAPAERTLVFNQVRFLQRQLPDSLPGIAGTPTALGVIRAALAVSPVDLARFEKELRRARS